jgi:hypothetical protein
VFLVGSQSDAIDQADQEEDGEALRRRSKEEGDERGRELVDNGRHCNIWRREETRTRADGVS